MNEMPNVTGVQVPRILSLPMGTDYSVGQEAVELAASVGLFLDPWQQAVLRRGLGERADGHWAAFEVCVLTSRQNGKGAILEALDLAALFLLGEELTLHSTHEFKTTVDHFRRVKFLIDGSDDLSSQIRIIRVTAGKESIELLNGQRLLFIARSKQSGRGFPAQRVILDEAQKLSDDQQDAVMPTTVAQPDPQIWYAATAPDKDIAPCEPLTRLRDRALKGDKRSLAYMEWSIDPHNDFCTTGCEDHDDPGNVQSWARANPGLGIRIPVENLARAFLTMGARGFAREHLGVGNWPIIGDEGWAVVTQDQWDTLADPPDPERGYVGSTPLDPVAFGIDVTPDQSWGSIAVAGRRADGAWHYEIIDHKPRSSWMVERIVELKEKWAPCAVVGSALGPTGSLLAPLRAAGVSVTTLSAVEEAAACGAWYAAVTDARNGRHRAQAALAAALSGATRRKLGEGWAWGRRDTTQDISPLVAVTRAMYGHATHAHLYRRDEADKSYFWNPEAVA